MTKPFLQFSDEEINAWLAAWRATRHALEDARLIVRLALADAPLDDTPPLQEKLDTINQQITAHDEAKLAFYANLTAMTPPSADLVGRIEQMANRVDDLINSAKAADQAIQIAEGVLQLFESATG